MKKPPAEFAAPQGANDLDGGLAMSVPNDGEEIDLRTIVQAAQGSGQPSPLVGNPRIRRMVEHGTAATQLHESGGIKADAFLQMHFTQLSLPYRDPGTLDFWERKNGQLRLVLEPGLIADADGTLRRAYPYGNIPRLFLIWLCTNALRHATAEISMGPTMSRFMSEIGLAEGGKQRARVGEQLRRLFAARISIIDTAAPAKGAGGLMREERKQMLVADEWTLWTSMTGDESGAIEGGRLVLSDAFHRAIKASSVPLSGRVIAELKNNPMQLDIYVWLVRRLHSARGQSNVSWEQLEEQFGGNYQRSRRFREAFKQNLHIVRLYYPDAGVWITDHGLILRRSGKHIPARGAAGGVTANDVYRTLGDDRDGSGKQRQG